MKYLLNLFFPKWTFFDQPGTRLRIIYKFKRGQSDCEEYLVPDHLKISIKNIFINYEANHFHYLNNLTNRFVIDFLNNKVKDHPEFSIITQEILKRHQDVNEFEVLVMSYPDLESNADSSEPVLPELANYFKRSKLISNNNYEQSIKSNLELNKSEQFALCSVRIVRNDQESKAE